MSLWNPFDGVVAPRSPSAETLKSGTSSNECHALPISYE
jgi:hypothetical protein